MPNKLYKLVWTSLLGGLNSIDCYGFLSFPLSFSPSAHPLAKIWMSNVAFYICCHYLVFCPLSSVSCKLSSVMYSVLCQKMQLIVCKNKVIYITSKIALEITQLYFEKIYVDHISKAHLRVPTLRTMCGISTVQVWRSITWLSPTPCFHFLSFVFCRTITVDIKLCEKIGRHSIIASYYVIVNIYNIGHNPVN